MSKEKKPLVRLVLRAPSKNSETSGVDKEIVVTVRPGWSREGAYSMALPGGKIEESDYVNAEVPIVAVAMIAIIREIAEELRFLIEKEYLIYVGSSTNGAGWTTHVLAMELPEKPILSVDSESAGTLWVDERRIKEDSIEFFADHLHLARLALAALDK